ncbi:VWA domain-containing protein [Streptomyces tanashiensis]|uniref:VWA domain-containing protein n=1 Tax=Streptomyces tanashiensis TaxID=67367 RepID=UPI0033ED82D5
MGIRSMLRKVFGRDREESPATSVPPQTRETPETSTPETPEARVTPEAAARRAADDLVAASFDNPHIPKARTADPEDAVAVPAEQEPEATAAAAEPEADAPEEEAQAEATAPAEPETAVADDADTSEAAEPEAAVVADDTTATEPEADTAEEPRAEADAPAEPETTVTADADASELAPEEQTETDPEAPAEREAAVVADDTPPAQPEADAPEEAQAEATAPAEPETAVADDADTSEAAAEPEAAVVADDTTASATEREADTADEPQAEAEADAPEAQPVEAQADEVRADAAPAVGAEAVPALSLAAVKAAAPHLADAYKAAGAQLKKQGLTGARAAVYLVVDRSGSMRGYFKDGSVQRLAEQVTALAAHLDETAAVTAVFFSTDIDGTVDLAPADLTPTRVEEINGTLGRLGRTNYHRAVEEVLAHHEKNDPARPALVVFQTDGAPESKTAATQALAEAADRPLHWRFVAWGEEDNKAFDYLRKLDGTPRTTTYFAGLTPVETAHAAFYRGLLAGLEF